MSRKRIKKKVKVKKSRKKRPSKNLKTMPLGQKIVIKDLNQAKPENVLGTVFNPIEFDIGDFDFQEDLLENYNLNQITDYDSLNAEAEMEIIPDSADEFVEQNNPEYYYSEKSEDNLTQRQKHIILYIGLTSVMAVIFVFWFYSVKQSLSQTLKYTSAKPNSQDEQKLQQGFNQIKTDFSNVTNTIQTQQNTINNFSDQTVTQIKEQQFKNTILNKVKDNLSQGNININQNQNSNLNSH